MVRESPQRRRRKNSLEVEPACPTMELHPGGDNSRAASPGGRVKNTDASGFTADHLLRVPDEGTRPSVDGLFHRRAISLAPHRRRPAGVQVACEPLPVDWVHRLCLVHDDQEHGAVDLGPDIDGGGLRADLQLLDVGLIQ